MITEDQLEQHAIQWRGQPYQHRTPNIERRREEKWRLAEAVRRLTKSINPIAN
jgi:hypothetical protein